MKILILGGEGFLGSNLTKKLEIKNNITIFGNKTRNSLQYFPEIKSRFIFGDIMDYVALDFVLKESFDAVIHCSARAGVSTYHKFPVDTAVTNGVGTYNVLEACKNNNVKKVIILSSSEVYGDAHEDCSEKTNSIFSPVDNLRLTYALSKLYGDSLAIAYHKQYGLNVCSVRPFGIWGPGQLGESMMSIFIRRAVHNEDVPVVLPGTQTRDFCYIDDFVDAIEKCIHSKKVSGRIFNIGNPKNYYSVLDFAKKIIEIVKSKSKIIFVDRKNVRDTIIRKSNIELAKKVLGFSSKITLEESIIKTAEWYRKNPVGEDMSV